MEKARRKQISNAAAAVWSALIASVVIGLIIGAGTF